MKVIKLSLVHICINYLALKQANYRNLKSVGANFRVLT